MRFPAVVMLVAGFVCAAPNLARAQEPPSSEPHWDYVGKNGPLNWGKMDPAWKTCAMGHEQSPVDIRNAKLDKALKPIEFHYVSGPVTLENTHNTVLVHVDKGSYIVVDGVRYDLQQFHFHHPSEEAVKGKFSDMVVHLVHRSADGKIAVVAVRYGLERGEPNAQLSTLFASLPKAVGQTAKVSDLVDPGGLLPPDRAYWTYTGSLTTPPCTEGVKWMIFEQEMSMSRDQLRAYAAVYPMDSRPLQDLHKRKIEASQ
jgi:carbonic anhydrase